MIIKTSKGPDHGRFTPFRTIRVSLRGSGGSGYTMCLKHEYRTHTRRLHSEENHVRKLLFPNENFAFPTKLVRISLIIAGWHIQPRQSRPGLNQSSGVSDDVQIMDWKGSDDVDLRIRAGFIWDVTLRCRRLESDRGSKISEYELWL